MVFTGHIKVIDVKFKNGYKVVKAVMENKTGIITLLDFDNNRIEKGMHLFVSGEVRKRNILVIKTISVL